MKRFGAFACILLCFIIVSCNLEFNKAPQYGTLGINIDADVSRSGSIKPIDDDITCVKYKLYGRLNSEVTYESEDYFTDKNTTVDNLLTGDWIFYVVGFNKNNLAIARSEDTLVKIKVLPQSRASFRLQYYEDGSGELNLTYKIPVENNRADKIIVTLINVDRTKESPQPIVIDIPSTPIDNYYTFSSSRVVPTGNYRLVAKTYDAEKELNTIAQQSVFIFKDISSSDTKVIRGITKAPTFSLSENILLSAQDITLSSNTPNSYIYYTTDTQKDPIKEGVLYTGPIKVDKNMTISAIAGANGLYYSDIVTKEYRVKAVAPSTETASGTYDCAQTIYLSTGTPNSQIRYTLDGANPNEESSLYTQDGIEISKNTVLKAITINQEYVNSDISTYEYKIRTQMPLTDIQEGVYGKKQDIRLISNTAADVYYTLNGNNPDKSSIKYSGEIIQISETTTIKAIAYQEGHEQSNIFSATFSIVPLSAPIFSLEAGEYFTNQSLTITQVQGADIYYTTDGTQPTKESNKYTEPVIIDKNMTVKAIVAKDGYDDTEVFSKKYIMKVSNIIPHGEDGTFTTTKYLFLSTSTPGAKIYYTTDGSTPTKENGTLYQSLIFIAETQTIKAVAIKDNWTSSNIVEKKYTMISNVNFSISDPPSLIELTITVPEDWIGAEAVIPGVSATLYATSKLWDPAVKYTWYIDGILVSTERLLRLGTKPNDNVYLLPGTHYITCFANNYGTEYSAEYTISVNPNATIGNPGYNYGVGMIGPAGGYIVYDCDEDNDFVYLTHGKGADNLISSECGWRYLEAAPEDISVGEICDFPFGFYRESDSGSNLFINGETTFNKTDCTSTSIGAGKANTEKLVNAMGSYAYKNASGSEKTEYYAANLCNGYEYNNYTDWFLPSRDELYILDDILRRKNISMSANCYWSSSEDQSTCLEAYFEGDEICTTGCDNREYNYRVRPIRAFLQ